MLLRRLLLNLPISVRGVGPLVRQDVALVGEAPQNQRLMINADVPAVSP